MRSQTDNNAWLQSLFLLQQFETISLSLAMQGELIPIQKNIYVSTMSVVGVMSQNCA